MMKANAIAARSIINNTMPKSAPMSLPMLLLGLLFGLSRSGLLRLGGNGYVHSSDGGQAGPAGSNIDGASLGLFVESFITEGSALGASVNSSDEGGIYKESLLSAEGIIDESSLEG